MRSFFSGILFGLIIVGTILSILRGVWWLMPSALFVGWIADLEIKQIFHGGAK